MRWDGGPFFTLSIYLPISSSLHDFILSAIFQNNKDGCEIPEMQLESTANRVVEQHPKSTIPTATHGVMTIPFIY
ncbi:hypothetical protein IWZ01DRAFT_505296 [Phyllosticta capitalensis]